jgi:ABC-2 type transport system ATP-binding protein/lipopolysaccharide transport system ATP-binding protein
MLKVMARVLYPTEGRVIMRGRIAPLLELGGGFHQELTGRENVYLNMALLGHSRQMTDKLFDSIVDFAEIGDFMEAPIRTYSTGMVARLGFAVATCFRPEILLIDEILSVGDAKFQEKCLKRMDDFQAQGTTIVIVSHSMTVVETFCRKALWLDHGRVQAIGATSEVVDRYIERGKPAGEVDRRTQVVRAGAKASRASVQRLEFTSLNEAGRLYPAEGVLDPQQGTLSVWLKFQKDVPQRGCVIFHTDDSRYVLYAARYQSPDSQRELRVIVGRAGGNRRVIDTYYGTGNFPEASALSGLGEWHLVTLTWYGYPSGVLRMYLDGNLAMERTYDPRYDSGHPLPTTIAIGMRPREWVGELIRQADGTIVDSRPETTLSIVDSGVEFQDLRLYTTCLLQEQVQALALAGSPEGVNQ